MSSVGDVKPDPTVIGNIAKPPFVQLPDPARIFAKRAERFRAVATARPLEAYLRFLADLTDMQLRILPDLPEPDWNFVRARRTVCDSTDQILSQEIDGGDGTNKEVCRACRSYAKVLYQQTDPALDPVADDVAALGLDLLVRESGIRRGSVNPYLLDY